MRSILLQFLLTAILAVLLTYVIVACNFRSPWNAAWWFGLPLIIAMVANRSLRMRALMGELLIAWLFIIICLTAEVLGGGP